MTEARQASETGTTEAATPSAHTPGPLVARCINDSPRPFAVINPNSPFGDEIVAGYLSEADAALYAAAPVLLTELCNMVEIYWGLHGDHNGDGGKPPDCIVRARAAIAHARPTGSAS